MSSADSNAHLISLNSSVWQKQELELNSIKIVILFREIMLADTLPDVLNLHSKKYKIYSEFLILSEIVTVTEMLTLVLYTI